MVRIVVISPYRFKAQNKFNSLIDSVVRKNPIIEAATDEFNDNYYVGFANETSLERIIAIPKDISQLLTDKYFDIVYIDKDYNEDETWTIRQHLIGQQSKPIIFF